METPADRLRHARIEAGFQKASDAIKRFGWTEQTYYSHENGRRSFHDDAPEYAWAFKVSLEWLLTGKGAKPDAELNEFIDDFKSLGSADRRTVAQMVRSLRASREQGPGQSE